MLTIPCDPKSSAWSGTITNSLAASAEESPGPYGTTLAQTSWLPVIRTLRMHPWFEGRLMVARAGEVFDAQGRIVDEQIHARLRDFVHGFAAFVAGG